tara:strand:- start:4148 stop:4381 length:234 start_codon:yes stop_codon:yes gene_type:complete
MILKTKITLQANVVDEREAGSPFMVAVLCKNYRIMCGHRHRTMGGVKKCMVEWMKNERADQFALIPFDLKWWCTGDE